MHCWRKPEALRLAAVLPLVVAGNLLAVAPAKKKGPGLLRRIGGAVKKGLKKAVGKTARAVSSGSGKLAKRLGEDYDQIAHLYESGLFSIEEIENVIEEGYKEIDRSKEKKDVSSCR